MAYLDGRRFQRLLLGGIARLVGERGHLDRINVYPVPDGDTGTNLALTFTAVGERLAATSTRHAGELLGAAADAALDGARGNSGAIFAQYLQGLSEFLAGHERVRPEELALALASAESFARSAIQNPAEGTVLTVMRDIAAAVAPGQLPENSDFLTLLTSLLNRAREAVATTRNTLASMRDAGVEDAGARGLLVLLEGMADALQPGLAPAMPIVEDGDPSARSPADYSHVGPPEHRFCTECLVTGSAVDRDGLRAELARIGSSVVVVGGSDQGPPPRPRQRSRGGVRHRAPLRQGVGGEGRRHAAPGAFAEGRRAARGDRGGLGRRPACRRLGRVRHPDGPPAGELRQREPPRQGGHDGRRLLGRAGAQSGAPQDLPAAARRFPPRLSNCCPPTSSTWWR